MGDSVTEVRTPTAGVLQSLLVAEGDRIEAGAVLALVEVMKMETEVRAEATGVVGSLGFEVGATLAEGDLLLTLSGGGESAPAAATAPLPRPKRPNPLQGYAQTSRRSSIAAAGRSTRAAPPRSPSVTSVAAAWRARTSRT